MVTKIHMQDQINNQIEQSMHEGYRLYIDDLLQNIATFLIIAVFLLLGLNW